MTLALALVITLISACALNAGYLIEHSVASQLPPLTMKRPLHSLKLLLGQRRWLLGFGIEAIGWALYEELQHDENGQLLSGSFMQYAVPRADRVPQVQIDYIEVPSAVGPFGAKGIAEAAVMAGTGAVANAVAAAIGARLRELPMTAPRVWRALNAR